MQTVTSQYVKLKDSDMRPINWKVLISFDKVYIDTIKFFTIGESLIGGGDLIKPVGADVIQNWDKYQYADFSDRVISLEWSRSVEDFASVSTAIADLVLDNTDDYFTPGFDSPIDPFILPSRPIKILTGFGNQLIPSFVGVTERMPVIDEEKKTATFHCVDFLSTILSRPLGESNLLTDKRTDEVLRSIFNDLDINDNQMELEEGTITIPYVYFARGTSVKDQIIQLVEAEQGRLFMDSQGKIQFKSRTSFSNNSVADFDLYNNILDINLKKEDKIINRVVISGEVREVQDNMEYFEITTSTEVKPGKSVEIWADFDDPVVSVDDPVYEDSAITSSFSVNTLANGSGSANATDVTLTDSDLFSQAYKMTFTNSGTETLFITNITLYAEPAIVVRDIYIEQSSDDSIEKYGEKELVLENNFIQNESIANFLGREIILNNDEYSDVYSLDVKGDMALELDDVVRINTGKGFGSFIVTRIENSITEGVDYRQTLHVRQFTIIRYFTIGLSLIGGGDYIKP